MRPNKISTVLGVMALSVGSACFASSQATPNVNWTQFQYDATLVGFNPYEKLLAPATVAGLKTKWTSAARGAEAANGIVYVGSADNNLYAINATTGALVWKDTDLGAPNEQSAPEVAHGLVYEGSDDFNLYAVNAATGALVSRCDFIEGEYKLCP